MISQHAPRLEGRLLDIGCGQQPYRGLFEQVTFYVGVDLPGGQLPGVTTEVYASGLALPFETASFDSVLCSEVLEHVAEPARLLAEAARVIRPGGRLLLSVPWLWPVHAAPHDYYRYTPYGLRYLLEQNGFEVEKLEKTSGLVAVIAQRLATGLAYGLGAERQPVLRPLSRLLGAFIQSVGGWVDLHLGRPGESLNYVLLARRVIR